MWTVIKFDKSKLNFLKTELKNKTGNDIIFYLPKLNIDKYYNNKISRKVVNLLGDYIFCYHKQFSDKRFVQYIKNTKGLKYLLSGYQSSQKDIAQFIAFLKSSENQSGIISKNIFKIFKNNFYKFSNGPFVNQIFKIIEIQKNRIDILIGEIRTSINKNNCLFYPV